MIEPVSFLLGMLTHDFLTRSLKKSQVTNILLSLIFGLVLVDMLLRVGAFDSMIIWWEGLPK